MRRGEIPSGRTIGQAVSDAYARETRIEVDRLKTKLTTLRKPDRKRRQREPDNRKVYIATKKADGWSATATLRAMDASERKDLEPLESWIRRSGLRLWKELWFCKDMKIRRAVKTYYHSIAPFSAKRSK
jgi:hypothetical protein